MFMFLNRNGSAVPSPVMPHPIFALAEGDSLTQSVNNGVVAYPNRFALADTTGSFTLVNHAHAGDTLSGVIARKAVDLALIAANPGASEYVLTCFVIANNESDPTYYPSGADQLVADTLAYFTDMKNGGYTKIIAGTMTDNSNDFNTTGGSWTAQVSNGFRALVGGGIVDATLDFFGAYFGLAGAYTNTVRSPDGLHYTNVQQADNTLEYGSLLNGIAQGSVAPGATTAISVFQALQDRITLQWDAGQSGGLYTDFILQYKPVSSNIWTTWSHQAGSRQIIATITGLSADTSYNFRHQFVGPHGSSRFVTLTASTEANTAGTFDVNRSSTNILWPYNPVTLSSGNTIATRTPSTPAAFPGVAVSSTGASSGLKYFEWIVKSNTHLETFGLCDTGFTNNTVGLFTNSAVGGGGPSSVVGFTSVNAINLAAWNLNDVGMIAFNMTTRKAWLGKNGTWGASGDPAAGTNEWISWSGTYTLAAAFGLDSAGASIQYVGSGFAYIPPTGFSGLG